MKLKNVIREHLPTFIKYSVVGVSGTLIDVVGFTLLVSLTDLPRNLSATLTFVLAVVNNYTWNRVWTFGSRAPGIGRQFAKFALISIGGLFLNLLLLAVFSTVTVTLLSAGSVDQLPPWANAMAKLGASGLVVFYNFLANRFITFHPRHENAR